MFKKWAVAAVLVIILILGLAGWFFLQQANIPKVEDLKALLPSGAMVYVEAKDLQGTWGKLKNTELYNLIQQLKGRILPLLPKTEDKNTFLNTTIKDLLESKIAGSFGKMGIISVYAPSGLGDEGPKARVLFLTRIDTKVKVDKEILEALTKSGELKGKKEKLVSERYQGLNFKVINLEKGGRLAYLSLRDVLVLSNDQLILKQVIDCLRNQLPALLSEERFKQAYENKSTEAAIFIFSDLKKAARFLSEAVKEVTSRKMKGNSFDDLAQLFKAYGLPDFDYGVFEASTKDGLHLSYSVFFDKAKMTEELKGFWSGMVLNKDMPALKFLPRETIMLNIGAAQKDPAAYYEYTSKAFEELASEQMKQSFLKGKQRLEDYFQKLGFNYANDVLPLMKETGFAFLGLEKVSFTPPQMPQAGAGQKNLPQLVFPFPRLLVFVKVADTVKAEAILSKALENFEKEMQDKAATLKVKAEVSSTASGTAKTPAVAVPTTQAEKPPEFIKEEIYNEVRIRSIVPSPAAMPFVSPSYSFLGDYLVISLNDTTLKRIIDTYKGKLRSFDSNPDFTSFKEKLPEEVSGATYLNTEDLAAETSKLKEMLALIRNSPAFGQIQDAVDLIDSILVQLSAIKAYVVIDAQHFKGDVSINIKGL